MMEFVYAYAYFILYAFLGWVCEDLYCGIPAKKFINRGFFYGPYCPIYGVGALLVLYPLLFVKDYPILVFILGVIITSTLEYITSWVMEILFKTRWWDYTRRKFNLNGRICAETMIPFGILGCFMIKVLNPIVFNFIETFQTNTIIIIGIIIFIIFITDSIISTCIIFNFRNTIKNIEKDATEEITKKVREVFLKKGYFQRRLIKAFPNMISKKERLNLIKEKVNQELKNLEKVSIETINKLKEELPNTKNEKEK